MFSDFEKSESACVPSAGDDPKSPEPGEPESGSATINALLGDFDTSGVPDEDQSATRESNSIPDRSTEVLIDAEFQLSDSDSDED